MFVLLNECMYILGNKGNSLEIVIDGKRVEVIRVYWYAVIRDGWYFLNKNVMLI